MTSATSEGPAPDDHLSDVISFIARMQARPEHRVSFVGIAPADIAVDLAEFDVTFFHEHDGEERVGLAGLDADPDMARAWFYGPWIDAADWDAVAERLWRAFVTALPGWVTEIEVSHCKANENVGRFAHDRGFTPFSDGWLMTFGRDRAASLPEEPDVVVLPDEHRDAVAELHDRLFPTSWPRGAAMLERLNEHRRVLVLIDDAGLAGYVQPEVRPDAGNAFIEFLGVHERARGRGSGRRLAAAALRWMFSFPQVEEVELFVRADNPAARAIYDALGFQRGDRMIGLRRTWP